MLIFLSKMRKYRWEILIRNLRLIFGCYCQSGSRARDAVRFVEPHPAAGFSYASRAVTSTATATGAAKAAGAAIASVAVTALFVTVWFWHWRICRHLSWTPIREAQALAKQAKGYSECARCRQPARRPDRRPVPCVSCQLPVPNSPFALTLCLSDCQTAWQHSVSAARRTEGQRDGETRDGSSPSSPLKFSLYISNTNRCVEQI